MMKALGAVSLFAVMCTACSSIPVPFTEVELGTKPTTHVLAYELALESDGIIIGLERAPKSVVCDVTRPQTDGSEASNGEPVFLCQENKGRFQQPDEDRKIAGRKKHFQRVIAKSKDVNFVSHAYRFSRQGKAAEKSCIYNVYAQHSERRRTRETCLEPANDAAISYYGDSWRVLDRVGTELAAPAAASYTHYIVMATGWNNLQYESLGHYNALISNLKKAHETAVRIDPSLGPFNPFVIGLTWDSVHGDMWLVDFLKRLFHVTSYSAKADEADEIGYVFANYLVNRALVPAVKNKNAKLVLVGHSFGARMLTRAMFSGPYLEPPAKAAADLMVGLQPALDANRFAAEYTPGGMANLLPEYSDGEGYPFSGFREVGAPIVYTTSHHDSANAASFATLSDHIGGPRGIQRIRNRSDLFDEFIWGELPVGNAVEDAVPVGNGVPGSRSCQRLIVRSTSNVAIINASNVILDHGDIDDLDVGRILYCVIGQALPVWQALIAGWKK